MPLPPTVVTPVLAAGAKLRVEGVAVGYAVFVQVDVDPTFANPAQGQWLVSGLEATVDPPAPLVAGDLVRAGQAPFGQTPTAWSSPVVVEPFAAAASAAAQPRPTYLDLDPQPDGGFARDIVIEVYGTPEEILRGGGWTWVLTVPVDTVVQTLGGDAEYLPGSRTRGEETCIWRHPFSVAFPPEIAAFDDLGGTFRLVPSIDLGVNVPPTVQVTLLVHDDPPTW